LHGDSKYVNGGTRRDEKKRKEKKMLEIWVVSTDERGIHGLRAGEAAVYEREKIYS